MDKGEAPMGRPIQKKWFGTSATAGPQIIVNGVKWKDGTTATSAYIVKQTGSNAYIVSNGSTKTERVFMVNAASTGALAAGQCFILATPFGGSALPCKKIAQFRVDLFAADGTVDSYSWSTQPARAAGQADLITAGQTGQPVNTVAPVVSGSTTPTSLLTSNDGTWTGTAPITYSYQWTLNGANVGTNINTYTIPAGAAGRLIVCTVTAMNSVSSASRASNTITTT
jgi:hypothetical protein